MDKLCLLLKDNTFVKNVVSSSLSSSSSPTMVVNFALAIIQGPFCRFEIVRDIMMWEKSWVSVAIEMLCFRLVVDVLL
jgi:hypothetical protein